MKEITISEANSIITSKIKEGCLLTAGTIDNCNTMTIGWGHLGVVWRKNVFICFVKPIRHTYKYMEDNEYFTISFYDSQYKKEIGYLGTHSGRDENKIEKVGFHPMELENSITFKEAKWTICCKKIYSQDLDLKAIPEDVVKQYYLNEAPHRVYYGEIINIYEN